MIVRHAMMSDIEQVLPLAERFYWQTPYKKRIPFDPVSIEGLLISAMETQTLIVAQDEENEPIVGFVCGLVTPVMYNRHFSQFVEFGWYVDRSARNKGFGRLMRALLETVIREQGVVQTSMAIIEGCSPPSAAQSLLADGYVHTESTFTKYFEQEGT